MLHNRRVIALSKVSDVRRVPVELQQARMILAHLPGCSLLARGGNLSNMSLVNAIARVAGFTSTKARPSLRAPLVGVETTAYAKQPGHSPLAPSDDRDGERQVEQFIASLPASPVTKATGPVQEATRPGRELAPASSTTSSRLRSLLSPEPRGGAPLPHRPAADALNGLSSESTAFPSPRGAGSSAGDATGDAGLSDERTHSNATGDAGQSDEQGFMGLTYVSVYVLMHVLTLTRSLLTLTRSLLTLTRSLLTLTRSLLMRWPGDGIAKFQFVELSGEICTSWIRHVNELVLAHKLARAREDRELDKVLCEYVLHVCVCLCCLSLPS